MLEKWASEKRAPTSITHLLICYLTLCSRICGKILFMFEWRSLKRVEFAMQQLLSDARIVLKLLFQEMRETGFPISYHNFLNFTGDDEDC